MKQIKSIFLALVLICSTALAFGQVTEYKEFTMLCQRPNGTIVARDTVTDADTMYLIFDTTVNLAAHSGATTKAGFPKLYSDRIYTWTAAPSITGTCAGTLIFQGSMTGTFSTSASPVSDWVTLISNTSQYNGASSFAVSNSLYFGYFILPQCQYKYVRAMWISSGTHTSALTGKCYVRNLP